MRKTLYLLATISLMSSAWAVILLGADCPSATYAHEVFTCTLYVTGTEGGHVILYPHGANGLFESLTSELNVEVEPLATKIVEVNLWSRDAGSDALIVDALNDENLAILKPLKFVSPPLAVSFPALTTEAGKRESFNVTVVGDASNVRLWLESPSPSIEVSDPVDLGEVHGKERAKMFLVPSPTSFGNYPVYLYVSFVDDKGMHVLRYRLEVWVNPSFYVVGVFLAALFVVVLLSYLAYRRFRKKKTSEAQ